MSSNTKIDIKSSNKSKEITQHFNTVLDVIYNLKPNGLITEEQYTHIHAIYNSVQDQTLKQNLSNLLMKALCNHCSQNIPKYHFNCNHNLCELCFSGYLNQYCENLDLLVPLTYSCSICSYQHVDRDMENIANDHWQRLKSYYQEKRLQNKIDSKCDMCELILESKYFPASSTHKPCSFHTICNECLSDIYNSGNYSCKKCNRGEKIKYDISSEKGYCMGCNQTVYFVGDYLTRICKLHTHCYSCLLEAEKGRCVACKQNLSYEDLETVGRKIYKQCGKCKKNLESALVVKKMCCSKKINCCREYGCTDSIVCVFCQSINEKGCFQCLHCESLLDAAALEQVLEAQSVIDNFVGELK